VQGRSGGRGAAGRLGFQAGRRWAQDVAAGRRRASLAAIRGLRQPSGRLRGLAAPVPRFGRHNGNAEQLNAGAQPRAPSRPLSAIHGPPPPAHDKLWPGKVAGGEATWLGRGDGRTGFGGAQSSTAKGFTLFSTILPYRRQQPTWPAGNSVEGRAPSSGRKSRPVSEGIVGGTFGPVNP